MGFVIKLSLSNLKKRKFRTWLTILGVMIGTLSLTIMITAGIGAKKTMLEQVEQMGSTRQITVTTNNETRKDRLLTDELVTEFRQMQGVKEAYPVLNFYGTENMSGYLAYFPIVGLPKEVLNHIELSEGDYPSAKGMRPGLVLGQAALKLFYNENKGIFLVDTLIEGEKLAGRKLDFSYHAAYEEGVSEEKRIKLSVTGITKNIYDYCIYTDMDTLKLFLRKNSGTGGILGQPLDKNGNPYNVWAYSSIIIEVNDMKDIDKLTEVITQRGFVAENNKETLENVTRMTGMVSLVLGIMGAVAAVVAVIGIINTMTTAVYDRISEIGLMKMLGSDRDDISFMFLFESGLLGFFGGLTGVILSYGVDIILNKKFVSMLGFVKGTELFHMPPWLALTGVAGAVAVSVLAGAIPASRAAKVEPLKALAGIE